METAKKLNYIFSSKQKREFFLLSIVIIVGSLLELLGVAAIMPLVEVVTNPKQITNDERYYWMYTHLNMHDEQKFIIVLVGILIAIYVMKNAYLLLMYDCQYKFTYNNRQMIAMRMMDCYMKQTYLFHLSKSVTEIQRNVREDIEMVFMAVLAIVQLLSELFTCFLLSVFLISVDKSISLGVLVSLAIFTVTFVRVTRDKSSFFGEMVRDSTLELDKWIRQSFEGIKEIKITDSERYYLDIINEKYRVRTQYCRYQDLVNVLPRPLFEALCIGTMLLVVGVKIARGVNLQYFIPVLSAFAVAAFRLLPSFGRIAGHVNRITFSKPAIDNLYNDLYEVDELLQKYIDEETKLKRGRKLQFEDGISIRNVSFSYSDTLHAVLEDVSFDIKKNTSIGLIGPSGGGKSTLADIILGVLKPDCGEVLCDGCDIEQNIIGWHMLLGYVPQTIYLIDDSIKNNVIFGHPNLYDEARVWKALEEAQLADFVRGLDKGLDTVVGERGVRLSGGQRQRIGIARALFLQPQIIIMDEATSALDNDTEAAVMSAIDHLKGNRTLVIIAHRLSTVTNCDEILEVSNKSICKKNKNDII